MVLAVGSLTMFAQTPAQTPTSSQPSREVQLLQRTAQVPNDVNALLDLARLYFDQRRYDESSRILQRAVAAVQHEALVNPTSTQPKTQTPLDPNEPVYRVGGDIKEPRRLKYVDPVYPAVARTAGVSGYVIVEAIIGKDGGVSDAKVVKSTPLLDEAALNAVRQWKYEPSTMNGAPIQVVMSVTVIFSTRLR
jgi:TonB family protein